MTDETDGGVMGKPQSNFQQPNYQSQGRGDESAMEVSIASNSQLATQPWEDTADDLITQQDKDKTWGLLYPHCGTFPRIKIDKDNYKLGRAQSNDYVIKSTDMGSERLFLAISKNQCEIYRNEVGVFLKDCSSNGTWLNGQKLGKNQCRPLEHDSEICFAAANRKVFVYRSTDPPKETFPTELTEKYVVSKFLGRGACGEVRLGFRIPDCHRVAIKIINKRTTSTIHSSSQSIMNEVKILQNVRHPCIIKLEDVIDTQNFLYIVLELAEGGELFDKIIEKTKLNEKEAKLHFYQLASAIQYLHNKNICHRDLKPENVLLCSVDETKPVVKITDMGLSKLVDLGTVLKTFCGTPNYLAPEVLHSKIVGGGATYSLKVDCWSLGVILYILLSGTPPFTEGRGPKCPPLSEQIITANYILYPQLFDQVSADAKDLIRNLLNPSPEERLSADEILKHPWLQDQAMLKEAQALMKTQSAADISPIPQRPALRQLEPPVSTPSTSSSTNSSVTITALKRMYVNSETDAASDKRMRVEAMEVVVEKKGRTEVDQSAQENANKEENMS